MRVSGRRQALVGQRLSCFAAEVAEHGFAKEGVGAGLIAFAVAAEPGDDVGVEPQGELLFNGAIEGIADGVAPEFIAERREVREVDGAIRLAREVGEAATG